HLGGQLGGGADEDPVVVADPVGELLGVEPGLDVHVELLAQEVNAGVGDLLGDEDARPAGHRAVVRAMPASRKTCWAAPTPLPGSTSAPSSRRTISRPARPTRMSNAPK